MNRLFYTILEMSLRGSYVILILLVARLLLRRAPRRISCLLWMAAFFRLICPVSISSFFSLMPREEIFTPPQLLNETFLTDAVVEHTTQGYIGISQTVVSPILLLAWVWLAGVVVMGTGSLISLWKLRRSLRGAVKAEDGAWEVAGLPTAFLMGIFRPRIYLPTGLSAAERAFVLRHERTHLRRGDWLLKLLAYFILCLHWFNPLVWLAFRLLCRDIEIACDERVLRDLGDEQRGAYSRTLLHLAGGARQGGILAFGEGDVKGRIRHLLKYKKPATVVTGVAAFMTVLLAAALLMNQKPENRPVWLTDLGLEQLERAELLHHSAGETSAVWFEGEQLARLARQLRGARAEIELTGSLRQELLSAEWTEYDSLYLLMEDGTLHTILRMGEGLMIDGTAYNPTGDWDEIWDVEGTEEGLSEEMQLAAFSQTENSQILTGLIGSIAYDPQRGELSFTIPKELGDQALVLSLTGRNAAGEEWTILTGEQEWTAGKTYRVQSENPETLIVSIRTGEEEETFEIPMAGRGSGYIGLSGQNSPVE